MDIASLETPVGRLALFARDEAIVAVSWKPARATAMTPLLARAVDQLEAYFDHRLDRFDLPLQAAGSPFQRRVYQAMAAIPFGATRSYGELAGELGAVARAVGGACGSNPIPILIPCHRVLAAAGRLGGFSGGAGLPTKRALLAHEGILSLELDL
jgi:methylated-DNA-[protein]-cysteine S-methyltransferase